MGGGGEAAMVAIAAVQAARTCVREVRFVLFGGEAWRAFTAAAGGGA